MLNYKTKVMAWLLLHLISFAIVNVSCFCSMFYGDYYWLFFLVIFLFIILSSFINLAWNILSHLEKQNIWYGSARSRKCTVFSK